jgi:hypothetical protein
MHLGAPKQLSDLRRFFLEPRLPKHRQYEALRAFLVEHRPAKEVARAFGYSLNSFHVLCHHFRREPEPVFFLTPRRGPQSQPKKSAARDLIVQLRKQNHSVYEISQTLKERHCPLSPTAVREVLRAEGFAALPRRLDEERPPPAGPSIEPVADVREFALTPRKLTTACGGLLYRTPRVFEQTVVLAGRRFRQIFIEDLGHQEPTILVTNQRHAPAKALLTRYAQRMLIENALSDAVRFFHIDALSSAVGLKVDFDMALLVLASGLYRLVARRMRGYGDAQARQIFRDLIDMPADVEITQKEVSVSFHRRAHLPILLASDLMEKPLPVPWWNGLPLRLTNYNSPVNSRKT